MSLFCKRRRSMTRISFSDDFLWGTATSAYQIEGAWNEGGKGESIWDRFAHTPGRIKDGSTGDIACDHYHLFTEDIALMRDLGLRAYRFSISWPRIFPLGKGAVNQQGLDFYSRLTDCLLEAGIEPLVTLYHWDLPQALEDVGGWANRDIAHWFGEYAAVVARKLGDRVELWTTMNEPQIFSMFGYYTGEHAPGLMDPSRYLSVSHYINLAHGEGVTAIRAQASDAKVGTVLQLPPIYPRSESEKDQKAARVMDGLMNRWYAEPVLIGSYPADILELLNPLGLPIMDGDLDRIYQPLDFVGLNLYTRAFAYHEPAVPLTEAMIDRDYRVPGATYTDYGWEVYPKAIYGSLLRFKKEWGDPPVYVTENGMARQDEIIDGHVNDQERIEFLTAYLAQVRRAMNDGVKVKGYFSWSFMDNFEWNEGYTKRFGIVYVDYATRERTPKASAYWYRNLIESGGYEWDRGV
jgi:beta-glucosidase